MKNQNVSLHSTVRTDRTSVIRLEILGKNIMQEKEIFKNQVEKAEAKLCLFTDDMILNIEKPRISTKNLLKLINKFSKNSGSMINM